MYNDLHASEIRLVRLLPGRWQDEIRCELKHAALPNRPIYTALSYAWGSTKGLKQILVNGGEQKVTANLESALRRLRKPDEAVTLWVDALSINQDNPQERSSQVSIMREIYNHAEEVVVFLGTPLSRDGRRPKKPEARVVFHYDVRDNCELEAFQRTSAELQSSDTSPALRNIDWALEVFRFLRYLAALGDLSTLTRNPAVKALNWPKAHTSYQTSFFEALRQLMKSRWWNRVWVIQEIVVPSKVVIAYGSVTAPWEVFCDAARSCIGIPKNSILSLFEPEYSVVLEGFSRTIIEIDRMRELWRTGRETQLLSLLRRFSARGATDDRDKVYALLGLARDGVQLSPNYALSTPDVFRDTALAIIDSTGSLSTLMGDLGRKKRQDLPSWVPDWSAAYDDVDRRRSDCADYYSASIGKQALTTTDKDLDTQLDWLNIPEDIRNTPKKMFEAENQWFYNNLCGVLNSAYSQWAKGQGEILSLEDRLSQRIRVPASFIDLVVVLGDVNYSSIHLGEVVRSWTILAHGPFFHGGPRPFRTKPGWADAFKRTICADLILSAVETNMYRRLTLGDMDTVTAWFIQGKDACFTADACHRSEQLAAASEEFFGDADADAGWQPLNTGHVENAIRLATNRRRFFITKNGYIGLGPASMREEDLVYILLGGQTPFILRSTATERNLTRAWFRGSPYQIVGDCYVHGMMDGAGVEPWADGVVRHFKEGHLNSWEDMAELIVEIV